MIIARNNLIGHGLLSRFRLVFWQKIVKLIAFFNHMPSESTMFTNQALYFEYELCRIRNIRFNRKKTCASVVDNLLIWNTSEIAIQVRKPC